MLALRARDIPLSVRVTRPDWRLRSADFVAAVPVYMHDFLEINAARLPYPLVVEGPLSPSEYQKTDPKQHFAIVSTRRGLMLWLFKTSQARTRFLNWARDKGASVEYVE